MKRLDFSALSVWILGVAVLSLGLLSSPPAQSAEVFFNQGMGRLDEQVLKALDEAADAAATGQQVTIDMMIFQFRDRQITEKILEITQAHPNLTVRMIGEFSGRNTTNSVRGGYFRPSYNQIPFLDSISQGRYSAGCRGVVESGKVPKRTPRNPGAGASAAEVAKFQSDLAQHTKYKGLVADCAEKLRQSYPAGPPQNIQARFKLDTPYVYNQATGRADFSHNASKGLNHHKGLVVRVGGVPLTVVTGSYNWSQTAETSNYENLMVFHYSDAIDRDMMYDYAAEFDAFFFDTTITGTPAEAAAYASWGRKKTVHQANRSRPAPGPPPTRVAPAQIPGTGSATGSITGVCDSTNPLFILSNGISAAACVLEPVNINNASRERLGQLALATSDISAIIGTRATPFADLADFETRTGIVLPSDANVEFGTNLIAINEAGADELTALPGIGPVLAARIIEHRNTYGEFESIEDLSDVRGIGASKLEGLWEFATAAYSKAYFSSRHLGETAGTGYSDVNGQKTILVRNAADNEVTEVAGTLNQPIIDLMRRVPGNPGDHVRIAAYLLDARAPEFDAIVNAARRGAKVQVVMNQAWTQGTTAALAAIVKAEGLDIEVRITQRTMHEKFGVFEDDVFNGSANLSSSSWKKHSEDRFMFKNQPALADKFAARFDQLWEDANVVTRARSKWGIRVLPGTGGRPIAP